MRPIREWSVAVIASMAIVVLFLAVGLVVIAHGYSGQCVTPQPDITTPTAAPPVRYQP